MADKLMRTQFDDAPLVAAKDPDPRAVGGAGTEESDQVIGRTVTINRPRAELYGFWRDFRNLPRFMHDIERITVTDAVHSHWVVSAPGESAEWDAVVTEDIPNEVIAWTSAEGAKVRNNGRVEFREAPAGRGTEVSITLVYDQPAGVLGKLIGKLYQKEPRIQARRELRRFKQLMETGEVSTAAPPHAAPRA